MSAHPAAYPETVLVVGNGARECALANALLASARLQRLLITPPNLGVLDPHFPDGRRVELHDVAVGDIDGMVSLARERGVQLAVIGSEAPLCAGLADALRAAGVATVGPGADAARLEGSKVYAKQFMQRHGIPTADFAVFSKYEALCEHLAAREGPVVLKADGLAAGKGVIVCDNPEEALAAAERMLAAREFGTAADQVLVEERLYGREVSFTCLIAGGRAEVLPPSSDYKRLLDGDCGPNTGGMGNICPTPYATDEIVVEFTQLVLAPFMRGLHEEGLDYRGFLFVGAMLTEAGLRVLEFNVRLGDPEAAVVLPLCKADWPAVFASIAAGELPGARASGPHADGTSALQDDAIRVRDAACVAVALASGNYPYGKSDPAVIEGIERVRDRGLLLAERDGAPVHGDVQLLFGGVERGADGALLATGGRVLTVSARAANLSLARRLAYEVAGNLHFDGMQFRSDIGKSN